MDTPFHYGILPMLDTAFQLFEENSKGKARTELVLQSMNDGDLIVVFGKHAVRDVEERLKATGKRNCVVIPTGREDVEDPSHFHQRLSMRFRQSYRDGGQRLHVDHTFVSAWIEAALVRVNHDFEKLVGMIGEFNIPVARPQLAAPSWTPNGTIRR